MLAIIVHSLSRVGGTESVVKLLANNLSSHLDVVVIETEKSTYVASDNNSFTVVNLSSNIKNEKLNMLFAMLKAGWYIRKKAIRDVYSTFGNLNILAILLCYGCNVIVCDHLCYRQS
ncbi:hypothetical protein, partial [Buttiauxella noackiae]|uniref:hypothetical protein n=1 Tax=Buttiauxella noackiae TaxID=82992 RepID=UPI0012EECC6A